jgi:hypothetical protein
MWTLALRFMPYLLTLVAIAGAAYKVESVGYQRGYQDRLRQDFKVTLREDMDRARLADDALWHTRVSDFTMMVSSLTRENAYARYVAAAEQLTDGLSDRVYAAERRAAGCAVPSTGAGDGAQVSGDTGPTGIGRLRALEQRVYDACAADGAALEALASRPVCECSDPAAARREAREGYLTVSHLRLRRPDDAAHPGHADRDP